MTGDDYHHITGGRGDSLDTITLIEAVADQSKAMIHRNVTTGHPAGEEIEAVHRLRTVGLAIMVAGAAADDLPRWTPAWYRRAEQIGDGNAA